MRKMKMKNINMLLYMFLAILYCNFIKRVKVFTIYYFTNYVISHKHQNIMSATKTHFLLCPLL